MAYNKTNWQNSPSTDTPINANNLNKIEEGIYQNSLKADQVGNITNLKTDNKQNLVNAINELKDREEIYADTDEEIKTNKTWNGKPIYIRNFRITTLPTNGIVVQFSENYNIDEFWLDYTHSWQEFGDVGNRLNLDFYYSSTDWTRYYVNRNGIYVHRGSGVSGYNYTYFVLEYTKTTD